MSLKVRSISNEPHNRVKRILSRSEMGYNRIKVNGSEIHRIRDMTFIDSVSGCPLVNITFEGSLTTSMDRRKTSTMKKARRRRG